MNELGMWSYLYLAAIIFLVADEVLQYIKGASNIDYLKSIICVGALLAGEALFMDLNLYEYIFIVVLLLISTDFAAIFKFKKRMARK